MGPDRDPWSPEAAEALAILDARRRLHVGLRRCEFRVRLLRGSGAISGGDGLVDRRLDRALRDRRLLGEMRGDLDRALRRVRRRTGDSAIARLVAAVPLARLQRNVVYDRLRGESWPRIASLHTRGDRGTAVRAFRQAIARFEATAAVLEADRRDPNATAADVARATGLTVRTVNLIRNHLTAMGGSHPAQVRASARVGGVRRRTGLGPRHERSANRPNPRGMAEPCPSWPYGGGQEPTAWRVLAVRPAAELSVKVALEQALGDRIRCRSLRPGRTGGGYLAIACTDPGALRTALEGVPGVIGWVGAEPLGREELGPMVAAGAGGNSDRGGPTRRRMP